MCRCVCVCVRTLAWRDAQPQRVARPPQDLGQVPVLQAPHRPALHGLQLVAGLDLTAASRRAATAHRHEAVGHQGGACGVGEERVSSNRALKRNFELGDRFY